MSYTKTNWVNDTTELNAENMNHIEGGIEQSYGQLLLAVDSVAPEECTTGDKYYNIETNKIYTATGTDTWGTTGVDAELGVFYIVLETQNIYTYNGETLISVGGGAGGGDSTPIGTVEAYAGSTVPDGYLMCDGSAVSRETYKDLYRVIGTTYGTGDGSTTFNLPNIKGRVVVMLDSSQTEFDTLGQTGGSKYIQQHTHKFNINSSYGTPGSSGGYMGGAAGIEHTVVGGVEGATTGNSGNLQPYIVLNYIIKVQKLAGTVLSEQLPVGTEVDFDGTSADIPIGWEQVDGWTLVDTKTGGTEIALPTDFNEIYIESSYGSSATCLVIPKQAFTSSKYFVGGGYYIPGGENKTCTWLATTTTIKLNAHILNGNDVKSSTTTVVYYR